MTRKTSKTTQTTEKATTTDTPDGSGQSSADSSGATPEGNQSAMAGRGRDDTQDPDSTEKPDRATPANDPPHDDDDSDS